MTVRRVGVNGNEGYGSFGLNVTSPDSIYTFDLLGEAEFFCEEYKRSDPGNPPVIGLFSRVYLRWKFSALSINADLIKSYNNVIRKAKLGTVIVKHRGYVTDEVFVSFPNQMSKIYSTVIKALISGEEEEIDDDLPCDEPPNDAQLTIVRDAPFVAANWSGSTVGQGVAFSSWAGVHLCDSIEFYPERGLDAYTFGGSYVFVNSPFTASTAAFADAPIINL